MAIPNSPAFSQDDVIVELGLPTASSLSTCFASASALSFDPTYEGAKDRLSNFRNYATAALAFDYKNVVGATTAVSAVAFDPLTTSGMAILVVYQNADISLTSLSVTDTLGTTWTEQSSPSIYFRVFYSTVTSTGSRDITLNGGVAAMFLNIVSFEKANTIRTIGTASSASSNTVTASPLSVGLPSSILAFYGMPANTDTYTIGNAPNFSETVRLSQNRRLIARTIFVESRAIASGQTSDLTLTMTLSKAYIRLIYFEINYTA